MLKVLKAFYGGADVKDIINDHFVSETEIRFSINNEVFGDPMPYVSKTLEIQIDHDGTVVDYIANEGENFCYPRSKYKVENTLVLTSCNRIEQILFAIAVNKEIIKEDFNLVVADGSTPNLDADKGIWMHASDDPYNLINNFNYNPNWQLISEYVKDIAKIKQFRVINVTPRLGKQVGEATLTSLGLNAAALLGSKYAVKLTGVCHLKYDVFAKFNEYLGDKSVATWHRTGFYNQKATRVFACRPDDLSTSLLNAGWGGWINEYDFLERKFERIINESMSPEKINHMSLDERDIIVDEGVARTDHRYVLYANLEKHGLLESEDVWIRKFLDGGIW
jgi:hypothetical protein